MRQQQLTFNCMRNSAAGATNVSSIKFSGLIVRKWVDLGLLWFAKRHGKKRNENLYFAK